jgi:hypothetical protein
VIQAMHKNSLLSLLAFALLTGGLVGCGENSVPENPSWANDIQPLMEARCVRCHGGGGMLNGDPDVPPNFTASTDPTAMVHVCPPATGGAAYTCAPTGGNFTTEAGLMTYTLQVKGTPILKTFLDYPMPPPPSEPLDDYEYNTLMKWAENPR